MSNDVIRVAPLHMADEVIIRQSQPQLTYRNGPLLNNVQIFTIFWGSQWGTDSALVQLASEINQFFDDILVSPLIDQLAEYDTNGVSIGQGDRIGTLVLTQPALHKSITDYGIQQQLAHLISSQQVPQPTPNTLYFFYLPPGVVSRDGRDASCKTYCGYHNSTPNGVYYAVMPYPGCQGCLGGFSILDALTATSSHEMCEAITDPVPGKGWYDDQNGEIGDICAWKFKQVGSHTVQQEWSNQHGQ